MMFPRPVSQKSSTPSSPPRPSSQSIIMNNNNSIVLSSTNEQLGRSSNNNKEEEQIMLVDRKSTTCNKRLPIKKRITSPFNMMMISKTTSIMVEARNDVSTRSATRTSSTLSFSSSSSSSSSPLLRMCHSPTNRSTAFPKSKTDALPLSAIMVSLPMVPNFKKISSSLSTSSTPIPSQAFVLSTRNDFSMALPTPHESSTLPSVFMNSTSSSKCSSTYNTNSSDSPTRSTITKTEITQNTNDADLLLQFRNAILQQHQQQQPKKTKTIATKKTKVYKKMKQPKGQQLKTTSPKGNQQEEHQPSNKTNKKKSSSSSKRRQPKFKRSKLEWNEMYNRLVQYYKQHGNCLVPANYQNDPQLASWTKNQKNRQSTMTPERIQLLDKLDFYVKRPPPTEKEKTAAANLALQDVYEKRWDSMLGRLEQFKQLHGNCDVPSTFPDDPHLSSWVRNQRFKRKDLSDDRKQRLTNLGFKWNLRMEKSNEIWNEMYRKLVLYKKEKGNCKVPAIYLPDPLLGKWVYRQKVGKYKLKENRKERLESIGFTWTF